MHPYCKACVRAYCKARYVKHAEQIKAEVRDYRARNVDLLRARSKASYEADKPKFAASMARYYKANREHLLAKARGYREALDMDVERAHKRAYRRANRDLTREWEHRRRAQERGTMVMPLTRAMIDAKVNYWGRKCWVCSGPFEAIDHVKPLSKGGSHILANLRPICGSCNSKKHSTWPYAPLRSTA
jgi:5-methylcytosine-specific restriction endonuclease McrA